MLDDETVRFLHEHRQPYSVLVGEPAKPAIVVELCADAVCISLMDYMLREWVIAHFEARDTDRLFLSQATYQTFRGKSDAVELREIHRFHEDGTVQIETHHFQSAVAAPHTFTMDVSRNWEPYPGFGDYESILALHWAEKLNAMKRDSNIPV